LLTARVTRRTKPLLHLSTSSFAIEIRYRLVAAASSNLAAQQHCQTGYSCLGACPIVQETVRSVPGFQARLLWTNSLASAGWLPLSDRLLRARLVLLQRAGRCSGDDPRPPLCRALPLVYSPLEDVSRDHIYWKRKGLEKGREERGWTCNEITHDGLYVAAAIGE